MMNAETNSVELKQLLYRNKNSNDLEWLGLTRNTILHHASILKAQEGDQRIFINASSMLRGTKFLSEMKENPLLIDPFLSQNMLTFIFTSLDILETKKEEKIVFASYSKNAGEDEHSLAVWELEMKREPKSPFWAEPMIEWAIFNYSFEL